jgi:cytidine deaminase
MAIITIEYEQYSNINELSPDDAELLRRAYEATTLSFAPYSKFNVGAAAKLKSGDIICNANIENASYPIGICAERNLLAAVNSKGSKRTINTIAISYKNDLMPNQNDIISPCGLCRQSLMEWETMQKQNVRIILGLPTSQVIIIRCAKDLLPLSFSGEFLQ